MNKVMGFMAGAICGVLVGAVPALLFPPASGSELIHSAEERLQLTKSEARLAMEQRKLELETQYQSAKRE